MSLNTIVSFAAVIFMAMVCLTQSVPVTKRMVQDGCISRPLLTGIKDGLYASIRFTVCTTLRVVIMIFHNPTGTITYRK